MRLRKGGLRGMVLLGIESGMFGTEMGECGVVQLVIQYRLLDLLMEELILRCPDQVTLLPYSKQETTAIFDLSITFEN